MSVYFNQNSSITKFNTKDSWIILNPIEKSIKEKIERIGTPLKDWDIKINYGIKTGFNEAFIIDGTTKDRLISEDPKSAEIIRPILRGRDIKRYSYNFADLWIITTFPSLKLNIEDYQAIKQHLVSFGYDRLKQTGDKGARKKTNNKWFEVQDTIAYWEDFYKQKLVWAETDIQMNFALVSKEYFLQKTCFFIVGKDLNYLQNFLNSKIAQYYIRTITPNLGEKGMSLTKEKVQLIPIPKLVNTKEYNLVDVKNLYGIDHYFYNVLKFNAEEIQFLET